MPDLGELSTRLTALYEHAVERVRDVEDAFPAASPEGAASRDNLLAYLAIRERDLVSLQLDLADAGLSSLGRLEGQVLTSLESVLARLGRQVAAEDVSAPTAVDARWLLSSRARALLGRPRAGRDTRIMVTLDASAITSPDLLDALLVAGMDIVRINCAHDTPAQWGALIDAVRAAEARLRAAGRGPARNCRISMDLGGPKIRTAPLACEPGRLRIAPLDLGKAKKPVAGVLDARAEWSSAGHGDGPAFTLAVPGQEAELERLQPGMILGLQDARGKARVLRVDGRCIGACVPVVAERKTAIEGGALLEGADGERLRVAPAMPQPVDVRVGPGDLLRIYRSAAFAGVPARGGEPASVGCTRPDALESVHAGHRVAVDDGKIRGVVVEETGDYLEVRVESPLTRVHGEKGLNFPDSVLELPALTGEDRQHLGFVVEHADAVALSFVHRPSDLFDLRDALQALGRPEFGVIAKIETREALHNLAAILLAGLELPRFGVMIARGDLAVEVGFETLALVQEDILCLCEAAHIPVIWATQVLETLAKSGLPARAEITDAAMGQRAECVMLNKGPHVVEAVSVLAELLEAEARHQVKKRQVFREFTAQKGIFEPAASGPES